MKNGADKDIVNYKGQKPIDYIQIHPEVKSLISYYSNETPEETSLATPSNIQEEVSLGGYEPVTDPDDISG